MTVQTVIITIVSYFLLLVLISLFTSGKADAKTFFTANRQSPWYLVAFGMIGASLSGVTFISIPGEVGAKNFSYFQIVLGYLVGYVVIANVLLPLYYRLNLVSIYSYLEERFGKVTYKTGAFYFLLSRTIGAAFRLYLVAGVLQFALFDPLGVPFWVTVLITIVLIWIYTFRGGIKTIVWTDTLQTAFMLIAVGITIWIIGKELDLDAAGLLDAINESKYSQIFYWDNSPLNFFKQFLAGAFIAIVMTGLDQDMMQKNLTCRNLKEAQRNMYSFSAVLIVVNLFFLALGALLYLYSEQKGIAIPEQTDKLYTLLALRHFPPLAGIVFLLGIVAAAYSSADSALTSLTTSFCVDFLDMGKDEQEEGSNTSTRIIVHIGFSLLLFMVIMSFWLINQYFESAAVISGLFTAAGYTYGPLLGLFTFGIFTRLRVWDPLTLIVTLSSPFLAFGIKELAAWLFGYQAGFEVLLLNGFITFAGLFILSILSPEEKSTSGGEVAPALDRGE